MTAFEAVTSRPLQLQIADHLAQRIISGELPDGARLPATLELAKLYHVTPVTIHKSLQHLVQRQLIERVPRRGTFVRSRERVNVIGLAFGKNPFLHQSPLYPQLLDQFQRQTPERDLNLKIYFDFESGNRALFDLEQDLASGEIKAVIACNRSNRLTRFLDEHPEVTWLEPIGLDQRGTVKKGVEYLVRQGFRNILVVSMLPQELEYEDFRDYFRDEQQGAAEAVAGTDAVAEVIRWGQTDADGYEKGKALFAAPARRPDAVLVNHDVVCRGLLLALMELGLKIPRDIAVLTHMNHGCEFASPVPLSVLEVNPARMVSVCLGTLTAALRNGTAGHVAIPKLTAELIPGRSCREVCGAQER